MLFVSLSQGAIHHAISDAGDRFQAESIGMETKQQHFLSKCHTNEPLSFSPHLFLLTYTTALLNSAF